MENQPTKLDKITKASIIVGILIMSLSVAYYFVVFLPQKEKLEIEQQIKEKEEKEKIAIEEIAKKETKIKEVQPSERALKAVAYALGSASKTQLKEFIEKFGNGTNDKYVAMRNMALSLDQKPEMLADIENLIGKPEQSVINVQQPSIQLQQPDYPKNCTSNTIGTYTYTNCF